MDRLLNPGNEIAMKREKPQCFSQKERAFFQVCPSPILFLQKSIKPWNNIELFNNIRQMSPDRTFFLLIMRLSFLIKYILEIGTVLQVKAEEKERPCYKI